MKLPPTAKTKRSKFMTTSFVYSSAAINIAWHGRLFLLNQVFTKLFLGEKNQVRERGYKYF
jgi:hypothetical protein